MKILESLKKYERKPRQAGRARLRKVGTECAGDRSTSYILAENSGKTSGFLVNRSKNCANDLVLLSASKELSRWITKGCQRFCISPGISCFGLCSSCGRDHGWGINYRSHFFFFQIGIGRPCACAVWVRDLRKPQTSRDTIYTSGFASYNYISRGLFKPSLCKTWSG